MGWIHLVQVLAIERCEDSLEDIQAAELILHAVPADKDRHPVALGSRFWTCSSIWSKAAALESRKDVLIVSVPEAQADLLPDDISDPVFSVLVLLL